MSPLAALALMLLSVGAGVVLLWWVERRTGHAGLLFLAGGVLLPLAGGLRLRSGVDLLGVLFVLQGVGFLYLYRWMRSRPRGDGAAPPG